MMDKESDNESNSLNQSTEILNPWLVIEESPKKRFKRVNILEV